MRNKFKMLALVALLVSAGTRAQAGVRV